MAFVVALITEGIRVASHVQPFAGHAFGIGMAGEEAIDHFLKSIRSFLGKESVDLCNGRRKPGEVESDAAQPTFAGGLRGGL